MKSQGLIRLILTIVFCLLMLPKVSNAATEYATFTSFYNPLILTSAGVISAAFIAGFGVISGATVLVAAFSLATGIVSDYAIDSALESYDYSKFIENSKAMTTLPLPRNKTGPDSYESAIQTLNKANIEEPLSNNHNQQIIKKAIEVINLSSQDTLSNEERAREQSLLALLYFITNDYMAAKKHSKIAYSLAIKSNIKATLPAFIGATSSLYELTPNIKKASQDFQYAVNGEPDNLMTPLLFTIYLDRMMYRFNDGYLPLSELHNIYIFSDKLPYDERKAIIQLDIVSRYFILIKLEQQKILSLTQGSKTIKGSPKTLVSVKRALKEYKFLLRHIDASLKQQSTILERRLKHKPKFLDKLTGKGIEEWEVQWNKKNTDLQALLSSYRSGVKALERSIEVLEHYQAELKQLHLAKEKVSAEQHQGIWDSNPWIRWLTLIVGLAFGCLHLFRRRNSN